MEKKHLYILLDIIFRNGSIKRLSRKGIDYNKIAKQTQLAIEEELVGYDEGRITLTEKGIELLKELEVTYKKTNKDEWIEKDEKNRIDKLEKNFIFIPRQDELSF